MTSKFKIFGLAMVAVLAMSAVVTSAAQAQFTTNAAPTTVTATSELGNDIIAIDGNSMECLSHFAGTTGETAVPSITITPTYTSCRSFGFAHGTFHMNECDYVFYSTGKFDIACPAGKVIIITASTCEVQIPGQTGLSKVTLTNHHPHMDMDFALSGITANRTKDGFLCPLNGTGHVSNASYVQAAVIHFEPKSGGTTISVD